jgi:3',5'-nucleoside bisphosphate phosphatase
MAEPKQGVHVNSDIDLHCHSTASDGHYSAAELIERAQSRGISMLAITDHDSAEGFRNGRQMAAETGIQLISGIELSTVWGGISIHLVGLNFDADSDAIRSAEQHQNQVRAERGVVIAERVGKRLGCTIPFADIVDLAGGRAEQVGRPHFARYMVEKQLVPSMAVAFSKYLGAGKVGDVKTGWPSLVDAVRWVRAGGGIPVLAHAHLYKMTRTKLRACITDFKEAGGIGLEVSYGLMDSSQRGQIAGLCKDFNLYGSCGSDYHGPNRFGLELGVMPVFPADVRPVWSLWRPAA